MRGRRILTEVRGLREQAAKDRETKLKAGEELSALRTNEKRLIGELRRAEEKNVRMSLELVGEQGRSGKLQSHLKLVSALVGILAGIDVLAILWLVTQ